MENGKLILVLPDGSKFKVGSETNGSKLRSSKDPKFMGDMVPDKNDTPYITKKKKINLDAIVQKALSGEETTDEPKSKYITKKKKEYITKKKKSNFITKKDD